jgi:hypothetical protein
MHNTVDIREAVVTAAGSTQAYKRQTKALKLNTDEGSSITVRNALHLCYP